MLLAARLRSASVHEEATPLIAAFPCLMDEFSAKHVAVMPFSKALYCSNVPRHVILESEILFHITNKMANLFDLDITGNVFDLNNSN